MDEALANPVRSGRKQPQRVRFGSSQSLSCLSFIDLSYAQERWKPDTMTEDSASSSTPYRVLARKYRPVDFSGLIGQEALVRTLTNAIESGRLAHAFVLTGVRGTGKTTTARIIARALTCIGPDGQGGPTITPCGVCEHCRAIAEDRHVDVMEMDAASRTGVGDIRELIEGIRYRPAAARFKIYIIDEVHMLSTAAFNALLKTLEEPPEHVKFIFATTEIRKIPVTVLSRCQRFDLRRIDSDVLSAHFAKIAEAEKVSIEHPALAMIARAADGSVRDGLSLLDQAIAHGNGIVSEIQVRDMLGLADRGRIFDLLDAVMRGDIATALTQLNDQYASGADPVVILQDLLELTHWLTRLKILPDQMDGPMVAEMERVRGAEMSTKLSMASLTRVWQMLLKGLGEVQIAPSPAQAAEMVLIRLAYAADLPPPAEVLEKMRSNRPTTSTASAPRNGGGFAPTSSPSGGGAAHAIAQQPSAAPQQHNAPQAAPQMKLSCWNDIVSLFIEKRESFLAAQMASEVHLVRLVPARGNEAGIIEFRPGAHASRDLASSISRFLGEWTGARWVVSLSNDPGEPSLRQQEAAAEDRKKEDARAHPLVQAILTTFPSAILEAVRETLPPQDDESDVSDMDDTEFADEDEDSVFFAFDTPIGE